MSPKFPWSLGLFQLGESFLAASEGKFQNKNNSPNKDFLGKFDDLDGFQSICSQMLQPKNTGTRFLYNDFFWLSIFCVQAISKGKNNGSLYDTKPKQCTNFSGKSRTKITIPKCIKFDPPQTFNVRFNDHLSKVKVKILGSRPYISPKNANNIPVGLNPPPTKWPIKLVISRGPPHNFTSFGVKKSPTYPFIFSHF